MVGLPLGAVSRQLETYGREDAARTNMNADIYRSLQRSWVLARTRRAVDKKGLAVALTFLVAMFFWGFWARECSDKTTEQVSHALQEQPDLSAEIEIRSAGKIAREAEFSGPVQAMTAIRGELDDPRRPR